MSTIIFYGFIALAIHLIKGFKRGFIDDEYQRERLKYLLWGRFTKSGSFIDRLR